MINGLILYALLQPSVLVDFHVSPAFLPKAMRNSYAHTLLLQSATKGSSLYKPLGQFFISLRHS
jgi:hypothetical protein